MRPQRIQPEVSAAVGTAHPSSPRFTPTHPNPSAVATSGSQPPDHGIRIRHDSPGFALAHPSAPVLAQPDPGGRITAATFATAHPELVGGRRFRSGPPIAATTLTPVRAGCQSTPVLAATRSNSPHHGIHRGSLSRIRAHTRQQSPRSDSRRPTTGSAHLSSHPHPNTSALTGAVSRRPITATAFATIHPGSHWRTQALQHSPQPDPGRPTALPQDRRSPRLAQARIGTPEPFSSHRDPIPSDRPRDPCSPQLAPGLIGAHRRQSRHPITAPECATERSRACHDPIRIAASRHPHPPRLTPVHTDTPRPFNIRRDPTQTVRPRNPRLSRPAPELIGGRRFRSGLPTTTSTPAPDHASATEPSSSHRDPTPATRPQDPRSPCPTTEFIGGRRFGCP